MNGDASAGAPRGAAGGAAGKVLVLTMSPVFARRAPAVQVANMAQAFAERGHAVTVVSPVEDPGVRGIAPEELLGFTPLFRRVTLARRVHRGQSYVNALRIARIAARERPTLIHSRDLRGCLIPALRGVPTVLELHTLTSVQGRQDRWVLSRLLRSPGLRCVIAISSGLAEDLVDELGVPRGRILVAHDAVRQLPAPEVERDGPSDPQGPAGPTAERLFDVGYTGSLYQGRGVGLLLDAASRASWMRLHLVGGPADEAEALRARLAGTDVGDRVVVHGLVTPARTRALQASFDVLVAPFERRVLTDSGIDSSRWMSPMKVFEYMASRRPMVVSDLPVLREVLRPDVDALLVEPEDVDALVAALAQLRAEPELGKRLAASAAARVATEFTWDGRVAAILARALPSGPTVTVVLATFGSGGAERVLLNLSSGLAQRGVRVRLVVLDARGPLADQIGDRVEVVDLGRRRARSAALRLRHELRADRAAVVLASQTHLNMLLRILRPLVRHPSRLVVREPQLPADPGRPERPGRPTLRSRLVARTLAGADIVVASSTPMAADLVRRGVPTDRVAVLANPVDVAAVRAAATSEHDVTPEVAVGTTVRAVAVGRLVDGKGYEDLLDALATDGASAVRLDVVGDGPRRGALEERAHRLGLDRRVAFLGQIDDRARLSRIVAAADVLVQPSQVEGMPNSVLEALALGTPVLATEDLAMLRELAEEVGPEALRLVPRARLAEALGSIRPSGGPVPRPSVLPGRFTTDAVVDRLLALLLPGDA